MLRGLYAVANSLEAATRNQEIVAENLSHAASPGYRRQALVFEVPDLDAPEEPRAHVGLGGPPTLGRSFTHYQSGPLEQTRNPLDVAVVGDAFFAVDGPSGTLYTRNGGFELSSTGQLQTHGGYPVRGVGAIPVDASNIVIASDGTVTANGAPVGQIELATFARPDLLRRVGGTFFEGNGAAPPAPGAARLQQGFREGSNVQPMHEMVSMIVGMRHYEAAERSMRALSDAVGQNTRLQA